ncbi:hypothetical protein ACJX0J_038485, partial [Zea mays]
VNRALPDPEPKKNPEGSMAPGAGDDSDPASYIHTVQHLIERCMTFGMSMEECMEALAKRADVQPVVTST